ncbi:MAG: DUF5118 domain-containing protein, partial [Rhodothermales bacterium]|nr:DUF5118 domain-containing protein [Rhodothermales bacterium]
ESDDALDMKHPLYYVFLAPLLLGACSSGTAVVAPDDADDGKAYGAVITHDAESDAGVLTVHRIDRKFYFEIPDSLFDRDVLLVTRI